MSFSPSATVHYSRRAHRGNRRWHVVYRLSGREDCSLRARRHTSALHCAPSTPLRSTHESLSGPVNVSGTKSVSRLLRHPSRGDAALAKINAIATHSRSKFARHVSLSSVSLHCVACVSTPSRAMPTQRPAHIDYTPAPGPKARCAAPQTPLRRRGRPLHSLRAASGARRRGAG